MSTPLEFFPYSEKTLTAAGIPVAEIARQVGTPVYIYSAEGLLQPFQRLHRALSGVDHLACFAVKSNSTLAVLKLLTQAGAGLDLVSGGELYRAGRIGVPGEKLVFSGVGKTRTEMRDALGFDGGRGICSFNVESTDELRVLNEVAASLGKKAPVSFRFNPDVDAKTHPYISTGLKKNKFGIQRREILEIARNLQAFPAIRLHGISIHIGSQLLSLAPLEDAFKRVGSLLEELAVITGAPLPIADLGGGVGIAYQKGDRAPKIESYAALIVKWFGPRSKLAKKLGAAPKILLEPGRLLSGNAGILVTEVLYRKRGAKKDFIVVDAAMNDLIRPALYEGYHEIVPARKAGGKQLKADIVGPVCETGDFFARDRLVPGSIQPGDLLAVLSTGAYGFSMSSNYNSRPRVPEVLVENGSFKVIREREIYDDLIRGEAL